MLVYLSEDPAFNPTSLKSQSRTVRLLVPVVDKFSNAKGFVLDHHIAGIKALYYKSSLI
jgi:hypothetical protein